MYDTLKFVFAAIALASLVAAYFVAPKRSVLLWAGLSAAAAGMSAHYHVFWSMAVFAMMIPWALVCAGDTIDMGWRAKVGFCVFLAFAAALCIYPTYADERYGRPEAGLPDEAQAAAHAEAKEGALGFSRFIRANIPFRLVRGLDLKGGMRLVYSVDVQEAIRDKRDRYFDDVRTELARSYGLTKEDAIPSTTELAELAKKVRVEKSREDVGKLTAIFENPDDAAKVNDEFLKRFIGETNVTRNADKSVTFRLKEDVETQVRDSAVAQAKDKIQRRIDGLGLKEASVSSRDEDIVIEVPGNDPKQFAEIRDLISQQARLEFKLLDDEANFFGPILRDAQREDVVREGIEARQENAPLGEGKGTQANEFPVLRKRDGETIQAALERFKEWVSTLNVPDTHEVVFEKWFEPNSDGEPVEVGWRAYYVKSRAEIVGDMIREAIAQPDSSDGGIGKWLVSIAFSPVGADRFETITGANVKKRFAIILDDEVESAPVIQTKIGGGSAVITMGQGNSQQQLANAKKLELVLKSGALPAPITETNNQLIGPTLGADAILQGVKGAGAGIMLVLLLMVVIYARAGMVANIAVLFNLVLQVAVLAMFGAAMTLPGLAGLALTVGIAVDANVLINERIRDELRAGKSPRAAVDIGYDRAFSAILDGHVTTLISGLILWQYGTGPIKGFAVTLVIGVAVSLFTGVVCTRIIFDWVVRWRKVKQLSLG